MPQAGAPPAAPPLVGVPLVDEGPMRRELLAQIAQLDREVGIVLTRLEPFGVRRLTARRGPRLLDTSELEAIRDELVEGLRRLTLADTPSEP